MERVSFLFLRSDTYRKKKHSNQNVVGEGRGLARCAGFSVAQTPRPYLLEVSMTISSFIRLWLGPEKTSSDFVDKQLETVERVNIQQLKKCISLYMSIYIP